MSPFVIIWLAGRIIVVVRVKGIGFKIPKEKQYKPPA
jgi:hypothetical protein